MPEVTQTELERFGLAVKEARSIGGLTLEQVGFGALGRDNAKGFISQIEKGKRNITSVTAGKLISFLELPKDLIKPFLTDQPEQDDFSPEDTRAAQLLAATEKEGDPGIGETLLIALAYEYADTNTTDLKLAYNDLKAALEAARNMKARAALPDNTGDGVAAVRAEVLRLNEEVGPDAGGEYLDDAIERKSAEMGALLDLGVDQDRVRNDPKAAAEKLVMKLRIEVAADALFDALRILQDEWYLRCRDMGGTFDGAVAMHLAEASLAAARNKDQRGAAQNDLGVALWTIGNRRTDSENLEEAITVFETSLTQVSRKKSPVKWAMIQNNLGNALQSLGYREGGTAKLMKAVKAFEAALSEWNRGEQPSQWATAKNNLGIALKILGERESVAAHLNRAIDAFNQALMERSRKKVPSEWATTKNNLGGALFALGDLNDDVTHFQAAVKAYSEALEERKRPQLPLEWAMTKHNLGNALHEIGMREQGTTSLYDAVKAYNDALEERTRKKVPVSWALTQENIASVQLALFSKTEEALYLEQALLAARNAQKVYLEADASFFIEKVAQLIGEIETLRAGLPGD